jgi:hypothetical protein
MQNGDLVNLHGLSIKELLVFKRSVQGQKYDYFNLIKECDRIDKQIEIKLAKKCNHKWKYYPATQMYESGSRICKICGLDKHQVIYDLTSTY